MTSTGFFKWLKHWWLSWFLEFVEDNIFNPGFLSGCIGVEIVVAMAVNGGSRVGGRESLIIQYQQSYSPMLLLLVFQRYKQ